MKKENKFKNFFADYGKALKDIVVAPWKEDKEVIGPAMHLTTIASCFGLLLGIIFFTPGLVSSAAMGLGALVLAIDEVASIAKERPPVIASTALATASSIVSPALMLVAYPAVAAGMAISESIQERNESKKSHDYTHGYSKNMELTNENNSYTDTSKTTPVSPNLDSNTQIDSTEISSPHNIEPEL